MSTLLSLKSYSRQLKRTKTIYLYLPTGASEDHKKRPLLIMHDGHNLFDPKTSAFGQTWKAKETLDFFANQNKEIILAGIACPSDDRFDEYSPWPSTNLAELIPRFAGHNYGGMGDLYLDWIVADLIPMLCEQYHVDEKRIYLAGASMGGYISLYGGYRYAHIFGKIGVFSPAVWFNEPNLLAYINDHFAASLGVYIDVGTKETSNSEISHFPELYLSGFRKVRDLIMRRGSQNLMSYIASKALHSETAWAKRFPNFLAWLD